MDDSHEKVDETAAWLQQEMSDIRQRVKQVEGLSLRQLLIRAGVNYSTWWRWYQYTLGHPRGQAPRIDNFARVKSTLGQIEAEHAPAE